MEIKRSMASVVGFFSHTMREEKEVGKNLEELIPPPRGQFQRVFLRIPPPRI